ncbi:hypothetical protein [Streptomyces sp. SAT1]|uniref:hypothetical protein n=1 Tax=unclassified Streptomyces TaxID=2593676 RepID=UPI001F44F546|nr:hypothetical protein [Streptomyces sp. SAT1]
MRVSRRIRHLPRGRRTMAAAALAAAAVGGLAACDPGGGLSTTTVSYTTDRTATAELNRRHVSVSWFSCTARSRDGGKASAPDRQSGPSPAASRSVLASVDCQGRTKDNRKITVTGQVDGTVDGACVRGDLTAKVGGKVLFHADGLGDCRATTVPTYRPPTYRPPTRLPTTYRPPAPRQPGPTVTVTVTRTVWCGTDPGCPPARGK